MVGTLLAAIGLYAIMVSMVRSQARDISVRMALGATPGRVQGEVLRSAFVVTTAGAVVGIAVALGAGHLLRSLLFGVSPSDPLAIVVAVATRIDPMEALRAD